MDKSETTTDASDKGNGEATNDTPELTAEEVQERTEKFTALCVDAFGYSPMDHTCMLSNMANRAVKEGALSKLTPSQALIMVIIQGAAPFWLQVMAKQLGGMPKEQAQAAASSWAGAQRDIILDMMTKQGNIVQQKIVQPGQRNALGIQEVPKSQ